MFSHQNIFMIMIDISMYLHRMMDPFLLLYGKGKIPGFFSDPSIAVDVVTFQDIYLLLQIDEIMP